MYVIPISRIPPFVNILSIPNMLISSTSVSVSSSALLGHAESHHCIAATSKLLALYLVRLSSFKPCTQQQAVAAEWPDACVLSTYWTHATHSNVRYTIAVDDHDASGLPERYC